MAQPLLSLLRAFNVSGKNPVRMAELKDLYESLGMLNVVTHLQSGNVIFDSLVGDTIKVANIIAAGLSAAFGAQIDVFIRTQADMHEILARNPFTNDRREDPSKLHVTFLSDLPDMSALQNLHPPSNSSDEFTVISREVFLYCPNGYGRTKLNNGFFERKLDLPATTRSWKTVTALNEMLAGREK